MLAFHRPAASFFTRFSPIFPRVFASKMSYTPFAQHEVVPDVIDAAPSHLLKVVYNDALAELGNILTPTQVQNPPKVSWDAADEKIQYTLCMTDPDAPSRKEPTYREWHHWLVGNIPGAKVEKGEVLSAYVGSGPPQGTGLHRYVFLLYKQPQANMDFSGVPRLTNTSAEGRGKFSIREFARKFNLGEPIAGNFYQAEWDDYVPKLYKQLGEA